MKRQANKLAHHRGGSGGA